MERNHNLTGLSQTLRRNMTKEERKLWYEFLRQQSVSFRRQYVIGDYIVDFYCHQAKLVIELDGSQHFDPNHIVADQKRTAYLQSQGLTVLRFTNLEIAKSFQGVCESILAYL